ncbi:MAG: GGDEF domain-containing protein [Elusimicrobia bacterium]|jgi:diguanylate cyclase (GGDEF)-like protein|nr:GGDEF domain-containing protein [Elusimicrobiota bacterium]
MINNRFNSDRDLQSINKQLAELKSEIDYLRQERYKILGEEKERFSRTIEIEIRKLTKHVETSMKELSKQTSLQINRLYDEGKKVGQKIDEISEEKAVKKAASTLKIMGKQAERQLAGNVKEQIDKETLKLKGGIEEAEQRAIRDELTQVFNRRYFIPKIKKELRIAKTVDEKVAMIIMDIDNFKNINDTYGHPAGDSVLTEIADILRENKREDDTLVRYGGEEFVVIFPGMNKEASYKAAERIRKAVNEHLFYWEGESFNVSLSIGGAVFPKDAQNYSDLLQKADKKLLNAKETGKNKTIFV